MSVIFKLELTKARCNTNIWCSYKVLGFIIHFFVILFDVQWPLISLSSKIQYRLLSIILFSYLAIKVRITSFKLGNFRAKMYWSNEKKKQNDESGENCQEDSS